MKKHTGIIIALAVGSLFATTSMVANAYGTDAKNGDVKCMGANSCKGKSACTTATSSCSGKNSCKGKGYVMAKNESECKKMGGHVK